jgi:pimeloyl-ACP methyl ester carboxylesterase
MRRLSRSALFSAWLATAAAVPVSAWGQAPPAGQTVPVNAFDLYYEVHGTGEPVLLLHGFGGCGGPRATR